MTLHPDEKAPLVETLVELKNLTKHFGPIRAAERVSFKVARGEVLGFLGPNGAGKSTTMKMVTCFLRPTSGTAEVCGHSILKHPLEVRRRIGYLPEGAPAYPDMTVQAFLRFAAEVRGFSGAERAKRVDRVVELVGLEGVLHQAIETLSKGFKRRVGLAQSLIHDPPVLILDEPTDGLDPNQKHEVRSLIRAMAPQKAIILSTHILEEVDAVCTRAIIIAGGKVVVDGKPEDLARKAPTHNCVRLAMPRKDAEAARKVLAGHDSIARVEAGPSVHADCDALLVTPKGGASILPLVASIARDHNWRIEEMRNERGSLDDVFRQLTAAGGAKP